MSTEGCVSGWRAGLGLLSVLAASGCSVQANTSLTADSIGFQTELTTIQVVSAVVGGKNLFIPSTIVVTDGAPTTLSLFNTTGKPHGFAIDELGVREVLPADEEFEVVLPELEAGRIYRVYCQLHPPHRSASLVVLPSR
ncbi:MAG: cupredoxin domain-containing protein [Myxococcota bacterium]